MGRDVGGWVVGGVCAGVMWDGMVVCFIEKGSSTRFSTSAFFHQTNTGVPLIHILKYFQIRLQIRRDIRIQSLTDRYIIKRQVKKKFKARRVLEYGCLRPWVV